MLTIQGIYNGRNIEPLEIIPFKEKKKVLITFLEDKSEKKTETKTSARALSDPFLELITREADADVTLDQVRNELSTIKGNLSDVIG